MRRFSLNIYCLLAAVFCPLAFAAGGINERGNGQVTRLRPIHIADYEAAMGLQRRESERFSGLSPQTQSELIYGTPGGMQNEPLGDTNGRES